MMNRAVCMVAILPFLVAASAAGARADDGAAGFLAQHKAYVGWEFGDGSVRTMKLSGSIVKLAKDGSTQPEYHVEVARLGAVERTTLTKTHGLTSSYGFTGTLFWYSDENGFTVPDRSDGTKFDIARTVLMSEGTTQLPATVQRRTTIDGTAVVVLREAVPHSVTVDLYEDPATGAYRRAVLEPDGDAETIDIDAYAQPATGKRVISAFHYDGSRRRFSYDKVVFNGPLDPSDLHPPKPTATWTFGSGSTPVEVRAPDFSGAEPGTAERRIYVNATVNGILGHFILDTGAGMIGMTDSFAKRANLKPVGTVSLGGIGNYSDRSTQLLRADTIAFAGGSTLHDAVVTGGLDFGGERADGLLGFDFLGGAIVALDLDASALQLFDATKLAPDEKDALVAVPDLTTGTPILPITVDGTTKMHALIDTGSPGFAFFPTSYSSKVRVFIDNDSLASTMTMMGGTGGSEIDRCGTIGSMAVGPISYTHVEVCLSPSMDGDTALIGLDLLQHFNVTFDYPDGVIYLYKRSKAPS